MCLHFTCAAAHKKIGNYWYMLPEYGQARKSMWDAINPHSGKRRIDEVFPKEIRAKGFSEQEMILPLKCGSTFQLIGSDNYKALIGSPPIGLVFSEYKVSNPQAWAYLRPILLENGGWAIFNSTPEGKNHFYSLCQYAKKSQANGGHWFYDELTANDSKIFTPEQLQSELEELQAEHGPIFGKSLWLQEYFCSFDAAILGSIWGEQLAIAKQQNRIRPLIPHLKSHPVHTAWDLGRSDDTVIWFYQNINNELRIIDYHESNFKDIPYYATLLKGKSEKRGFTYGIHTLPHDARIKTLASGGTNILQQLTSELDNKFGLIAALKKYPLQHQIQAARKTFERCYFDESTTEVGIEHLKSYKREWDEEKKVFTQNPVHDGSSHASSAWCTLSLSWNQAPTEEHDGTTVIGSDEIYDTSNIIPLNRNPTFAQMKAAHFIKSKRLRRSTY